MSDKVIRYVGILLSNCEYNLVILFFGETYFTIDCTIEEGNKLIFDSIAGHERGNNREFMDSIDPDSSLISFHLFLEDLEGVKIFHPTIFKFLLKLQKCLKEFRILIISDGYETLIKAIYEKTSLSPLLPSMFHYPYEFILLNWFF